MAVIHRTAQVPYSASEMLALVNDIEAYPEFLHWCHAARIESASDGIVEAALDIGIAGIYRTMRTRNTTRPPQDGAPGQIRIELIQGPIKQLSGNWVFVDRPDGGCDIELDLAYEVQLSPFGMMLRTLFDEIANSQLKAFIRRAGVVYGPR